MRVSNSESRVQGCCVRGAGCALNNLGARLSYGLWCLLLTGKTTRRRPVGMQDSTGAFPRRTLGPPVWEAAWLEAEAGGAGCAC